MRVEVGLLRQQTVESTVVRLTEWKLGLKEPRTGLFKRTFCNNGNTLLSGLTNKVAIWDF